MPCLGAEAKFLQYDRARDLWVSNSVTLHISN